ncbi:MAG TPA: 50S ribosomal protein L35 [Firmicutes bacterium]|nr:50S ribosomal protein L35 [Bacillota bacterium]HHY99387.1 50S ribosomal protein L35 [Bacillota bacterium]
MPKLKTHRGAAKRFKVSGTGKIIRFKAYRSHLLSAKTKKQKRHLRKDVVMEKGDSGRIRKLIPFL